MRITNQESRITVIKKMRYVTILLLIFSLTSCFVIRNSIAYAQTVPLQSLRVYPIINDLQLISGKPTTFPVTIQNLSVDPVGIHTQLSGYDQIGEVPLYEQKQSAIINWTKVSKTDILIPPHSKKAITVTIIPPSHLGPNGYYETIFLTPIVNQETTPDSPIILSRVGVLVLGTIGTLNYNDLAKKVTITEFSPSHEIVNAFPKTIAFTVNNYYFTHFDAKPFLTITPLFGKPQTTLLEDKHVLPGSTRIWQIKIPSETPNIFYQIHLAVSVGGGKQVIANTWFVVLPYKLIIIVCIIVAILYLAIFKWKRVKKFIKILLKGEN